MAALFSIYAIYSIAAKTASEERAGGLLTNAEGGVVSEFLGPTERAPLKYGRGRENQPRTAIVFVSPARLER